MNPGGFTIKNWVSTLAVLALVGAVTTTLPANAVAHIRTTSTHAVEPVPTCPLTEPIIAAALRPIKHHVPFRSGANEDKYRALDKGLHLESFAIANPVKPSAPLTPCHTSTKRGV